MSGTSVPAHDVERELCCDEWVVSCSCGFRLAGVSTEADAENVRQMHLLSPTTPSPLRVVRP